MLKKHPMRQWIYIFILIVALCGVSTYWLQAKTLDIIIGGAMGDGLECKMDDDCPENEFCHQELYYCAPCQVPPYEWTGTQCVCPQGSVEKDGKECVECLTDADCKSADKYCNTNHNMCITCKKPKIWYDNMCSCPAGTHEVAGECTCDNPNEILTNDGVCVCSLNEEKCSLSMFNPLQCACCPQNKPVWSAGTCRSCADIDADKPLWNSALKVCQGCPADKPYWLESLQKCAECRTNADCPGSKPICNENHVCEPCPDNLYFDGQKCVACPYEGEYYDKSRDKCVIDLPTATFNRDFGRRRESYGIVNPKIGPYPVAYTAYVTGNVDDYLHLDRFGGGSHYGGQTGNGGPMRGTCLNSGQEPIGWLINRQFGTLPANTTAMVWVYSNTGWNTFSAANGVAKIWLERPTGVK